MAAQLSWVEDGPIQTFPICRQFIKEADMKHWASYTSHRRKATAEDMTEEEKNEQDEWQKKKKARIERRLKKENAVKEKNKVSITYRLRNHTSCLDFCYVEIVYLCESLS